MFLKGRPISLHILNLGTFAVGDQRVIGIPGFLITTDLASGFSSIPALPMPMPAILWEPARPKGWHRLVTLWILARRT
jgi:hypothetical protein